jgi:hypothetical protein
MENQLYRENDIIWGVLDMGDVVPKDQTRITDNAENLWSSIRSTNGAETESVKPGEANGALGGSLHSVLRGDEMDR